MARERLLAFAVFLLATLATSVAGAAPALPRAAASAATYYDRACHALGGRLLSGADRPGVLSADLDGDGRPDYVLDPTPMRCSAAATAFCANDGCQILVSLSSRRNRRPMIILGADPNVARRAQGEVLEVWASRFDCPGTSRTQACWAIYRWARSGRLLTVRHELRPMTG